MGINSKYMIANIRNNKLRIPLMVLYVCVVIIMFTVFTCVPIVINKYTEDTGRALYGNSDIYIAGSQDSSNQITSLYHMPTEINNSSEYVISMFAIQGLFSYKERVVSSLVVGANYSEVLRFNPPKIIEGSVNELNPNEAIIGRATAKLQNITIGNECEIVFMGKPQYLKVVAIAEDSGVFSLKSQNMILVSKQTIKNIVSSMLPVEGMFNICVVKLMDNSPQNVQSGIDLLKESYPDWNIYNASNSAELLSVVSQGLAPIITAFAIFLLFCIFISYNLMRQLYDSPTKQFRIIRNLRMPYNTQMANLLIENIFYSAVSSLLCVLLIYNVLEIAADSTRGFLFNYLGLNFLITVVLVSAILALSSLIIPITLNTKQNSKPLMFEDKEKSKNNMLTQILIGLVFTLSIIFAVLQPNGKLVYFSPIIVFLLIISLIYIFPYIMKYVAILFGKIFYKNKLNQFYRQNKYFETTLKVVSRCLFASVFFAVFLLGALSTFKHNYIASMNVDYYTIMIKDINDGKSHQIYNEINSMDIVDNAYKTTIFNDVSLNYKNFRDVEVSSLKGLSLENINKIYGKQIIGDTREIFSRLKNKQSNILLNYSYYYVNEINVGDKINIDITQGDVVKSFEFEVVGFIDTSEDSGNMAIVNIEAINQLLSIEDCNGIMIKVDEFDADSVFGYITQKYGTNYTTLSVFESQKMVNDIIEKPIRIFDYFTMLIILFCMIFIPGGIYIVLKRVEVNKRIFMGCSNPNQLKFAYLLEMVYIFTFSVLLAFISVCLLKEQLTNIFALDKAYVPWQMPLSEISLMLIFVSVAVYLMCFVLYLKNANNIRNNCKI